MSSTDSEAFKFGLSLGSGELARGSGPNSFSWEVPGRGSDAVGLAELEAAPNSGAKVVRDDTSKFGIDVMGPGIVVGEISLKF